MTKGPGTQRFLAPVGGHLGLSTGLKMEGTSWETLLAPQACVWQAHRSTYSTECLSTALVYARTHKATHGHLAQEVKGCPSHLKNSRSEVLRAVSLPASYCSSHLWEAPPHHCLSFQVHTTAGRLALLLPIKAIPELYV